MSDSQPASKGPSAVGRTFFADARQGVIGGIAFAVVSAIALGTAAALKGTVPAWVFVGALVITVTFCAFVALGAELKAVRLRAERDEARKREAKLTDERAREQEAAAERLSKQRTESEKAIRELREQVAAATGGEAVIAIRWQGMMRQAGTLRTEFGNASRIPTSEDRSLLVAVAREFSTMANGDAIADEIAERWAGDGGGAQAYLSALALLNARAQSFGSEEALTPRRDFGSADAGRGVPIPSSAHPA